MKEGIHPKYHAVTARCVCGNTIETGSVVEDIRIEICNNCHPFYAGTQKIVDTEGRVDRFKKRYDTVDVGKKSAKKLKEEKRMAEELAKKEAEKKKEQEKIKAAKEAKKEAKAKARERAKQAEEMKKQLEEKQKEKIEAAKADTEETKTTQTAQTTETPEATVAEEAKEETTEEKVQEANS